MARSVREVAPRVISPSGISTSNASSSPTTRLSRAAESRPRSRSGRVVVRVTSSGSTLQPLGQQRPHPGVDGRPASASACPALRPAPAPHCSGAGRGWWKSGAPWRWLRMPSPGPPRVAAPPGPGPAALPGADRAVAGAARRAGHRRPARRHELAVPLPRAPTRTWRRRSARRSSTSAATRHRGERWYRAHFDPQVGRRRLRFEATPDYLFHPLAADRAAALVPDAKLVVLLRDPVARAWSHYRHMVRLGYETLDFAAALDGRGRSAAPPTWTGWPPTPATTPRPCCATPTSPAAATPSSCARWFDRFPREQFLVIRSEDLFDRSGAGGSRRSSTFLGLAAVAAAGRSATPAGRPAPATRASDRDARRPLDACVRPSDEPNAELGRPARRRPRRGGDESGVSCR